MSRALVTLATGGHQQLLEIALPSFRAFAALHDYEILIAEPVDTTRPASWLKIPALKAALQTHDDALWVDADIVITDPTDDLSVPEDAWQALVEHHTNDGYVPNLGVWYVRRRMRPWLDAAWRMTEYLNHPWWEQAAVISLMGYRGQPYHLDTPTALYRRTRFLDAGWNVHRDDRRRAEHERFMHATMHPDRLAVMRDWAKLAVAA